MATNNKISTVVSSQVPEFVRADHPVFVAFLQAYYEYLEQSNTTLSFGKTIERAKNIRNYFDTDKITDTGLEEFNTHLYNEFLSLIPKDAPSDKSKLLKNIKDFYRSKGTEKSFNFLFQLLFGEQPDFYYPKTDILIASSGKWLIEKSIRLTDVYVNGIADESITSLVKFKNTKVVGNTSTAEAQVERVVVSYENGVRYNEFFLSKQKGTFSSGEQVFAINIDNETLSGNLISGYVSSIAINSGGTGYTAGVSIPITGGGGTGAAATISRVSSGNVSNVTVVSGGAGYRLSDLILFTGGGGTGANANVSQVLLDGSVHPNTYNINSDVIDTYNATAIGAYSNSSGGDANTSLANTLTFFVYGNTGPIVAVQVLSGGNNYASLPTATISANTRIRNLGIVGRLKINAGGTGYSNGATLIFTNIPGSYGYGANGNVVVNASGSIIRTILQPLSAGQTIGGSGYNQNFLPLVTVSGAGSGANITVESLLGFGGEFVAATGTAGVIEEITITNRGSGYTSAPIVNLTSLGDGTANATANIVAGVFTYPGRFKDDTGLLSSSNYLEDRDYYQNFSYVIKLKKSIEEYRKYVNDLVHPAGMKLWGEYMYDSDPPVDQSITLNSYISRIIPVPGGTKSNTMYYGHNASETVYGTSNYESTVLTSAKTSNTKTLTISFFVKPDYSSGFHNNAKIIYAETPTFSSSISNADAFGTEGPARFQIYITSSNTIGFYSQNTATSGNSVFRMESNVANSLSSNTWYNIVASIDTANNQNCRIYINDYPSYNVLTRVDSNVQFVFGTSSGARWTGSANFRNRFVGSLAHFWLTTNTALDISNTQIRRTFAGYLPNGDIKLGYLGTNGNSSIITTDYGVAPQIYLREVVAGSPSSNNWVNSGLRSATWTSETNPYYLTSNNESISTGSVFVSNT